MKLVKYALLGLIPLLFSGCIFTEYKTIEVPKYIVRPMPILKTYDCNSSYKFIGLVKEKGFIKVPEKQFKEYINIKKDLEANLEKANNQVKLYLLLNSQIIIKDK